MPLDTPATTDSRALAALLFGNAVVYTLDAFGSLHSSPWTAETFGSDPEKAASARRYVRKASAVSLGLGIMSSWVAGNLWPLAGVIVMDAYMIHTYEMALRRAKGGSDDWRAVGDSE